MDPEPRPLFCTSTEKKKGLPYQNDFLRKKPISVLETDEVTRIDGTVEVVEWVGKVGTEQ